MNVIRVNDICVGQAFTVDKYLNGMECIILQDSGLTQTYYNETPEDKFEVVLYECEWANGEVNLVPKFNLKKRPPDNETLHEMLERVKNMDLEVVC